MLVAAIIVYMLLTLMVGIFAGRLVHNTADFMVAGKRLPLSMATFTVFATWFGSETLLGSSSAFTQGGLLAVIEDPFGAALCLVLVGLFFARPLYRMNLLTFGDFYRVKFGARAEFLAALFMVLSYLGWIAAQMVAIGILLHTVVGISIHTGIVLASVVVVFYTFFGGMWAVSITDFVQTIMIVVGIVWATVEVTQQAGGYQSLLAAQPEGFFRFIPTPQSGTMGWIEYFAAWITIGLGSIPQQDIYQRVMASRSERVAVWSAFLGGIMYLSVGLLPLFLGMAAQKILAVEVVDNQSMLPQLILNHTNIVVQIMFFGALISAIMSTASGAILAPASVLSENLLKPFFGITNDRQMLWLVRGSVVAVASISLAMAMGRQNIYELVGESSAMSLVSLFVPLVAGLYCKGNNEFAALCSMILGFVCWFVFNFWVEIALPSLIVGFIASIGGYILGSVLYPIIRRNLDELA